MAYTSFFSSNAGATKAKADDSGNSTGVGGKGGYKSFFGSQVKSAPTADQLKTDRAAKVKQDTLDKQQRDQQAKQQKQQADDAAAKARSNSLLGKTQKFVSDAIVKPIVNTGKAVGDTAASIVQDASGNKRQATKSATAAKSAYDQSAANVLTQRYASVRDETIKQVKHLAGATSTEQERKSILDNQKKAGNNKDYSEATKGIKSGNAAGTIKTQKMAASGASKQQIHDELVKQSKATDAQNRKMASTATAIATDVVGGGLVKSGSRAAKAELAVRTAETGVAGGVNAEASTLAANPNATQKELGQAGAAGLFGGALLHLGGKAVGTGLEKTGVAGDAEAAKALHNRQVAQSLFDLSNKLRPSKAAASVAGETRPGLAGTVSDAAGSATGQTGVKGAVPSDHSVAVASIQQHLNDNYKPAHGSADEAFAHEHLTKNTDQALQDYKERTKRVFGSENIVGGDDAKYSVPGMAADKSSAYHEPSSQFAKGYYRHLLSDPKTKDNPVLITAGGTGAGKTSALKKDFLENGVNPHDYAAIVDTNSTTLHAASSRIEPALATGRPVQVQFVYRDPVEAYHNGVIPRARTEGRAVTAAQHAETHAGSINAIKEIADKYKDNPNVTVKIIDNSRGRDNSIVVNLDFLHDKSYTKSEIEAKIHDLLDQHLKEGKITHEEHTTFKGQKADQAVQQPELAPRKNGPDVSGVESSAKPKDERQPQPANQKAEVAKVPTIRAYGREIELSEKNGYEAIKTAVTGADGKPVYIYRKVERSGNNAKGTNLKTNWYSSTGGKLTDAQAEAGIKGNAQMVGYTPKQEVAKVSNRQPKEYNPNSSKEVKVVSTEKPRGAETPEIKTSKLANRTETIGLKKGLTEAFGDKPEYAKVNMHNQAEAATSLLKQDPERLTRIAMGIERPPEGLLPESAWVAAVNHATKTKDGELLRQLGTESHLVSEATGMGQRIRALGELSPNNPAKAIKDVQDARIKAAESRSGTTVAKATSKEVQAIRAAKPKVTKETWSSFVESLKC